MNLKLQSIDNLQEISDVQAESLSGGAFEVTTNPSTGIGTGGRIDTQSFGGTSARVSLSNTTFLGIRNTDSNNDLGDNFSVVFEDANGNQTPGTNEVLVGPGLFGGPGREVVPVSEILNAQINGADFARIRQFEIF